MDRLYLHRGGDVSEHSGCHLLPEADRSDGVVSAFRQRSRMLDKLRALMLRSALPPDGDDRALGISDLPAAHEQANQILAQFESSLEASGDEATQQRLADLRHAESQWNGSNITNSGKASQTRVIVLSMHSDEGYVLRALKAGARGYLVKESAEADLMTAVRTVHSGKAFFSPSVSALLVEDYVRQMRDRGVEDSYEYKRNWLQAR